MKTNPSKLNQLSPEQRQGKARFKPTALALAFMSLSSAVLPVQSVQAQGANLLEEVIVTARKREESLQEVPVVVSVLSEDMINSQRIESIVGIGTIVPGLTATRNFASTAGNIYLRGVGTGGGSPLFDQAVAINIDGVGISSAQMMNSAMFDVKQIEVLRGPQALFFGKNSPGGVIAIHTKDPTDEFEMELTAMYETETEEPTFRGIVSGPISETLSGRLSLGWAENDQHYLDVYNFDEFETGPDGEPVQTAFEAGSNPVTTERTFALGTLLWEPTDTFSASLKYAHLEDERDGMSNYNFQRTSCGLGAPQVLYPVPGINNCKMDDKVIAGGFSPAIVERSLTDSNEQGNGYVDNEDDFVALEMNYEMANNLSLTSVTGYYENSSDRYSDASNQAAAGLGNPSAFTLEQWTQEIRLVSSYDGPVNFTLGAYYEDKEISDSNEVIAGSNINGLPVSVFGVVGINAGRQQTSQDSEAYSVFGQLEWDFAENWTVSAGARYSYEEKDASIIASQGATPELGIPATPPTDIPLADPDEDWDNLSPELTLSYQYSQDIMFFASYKEGFKSGGYDASFRPTDLLLLTEPYDNLLEEEEASGFEVGMKSDLLDGRLRLNVTAFSYEYEDLQLSKVVLGPTGAPTLQAFNAGDSTTEGLELETFWLTPIDGLSLTANVAWVNAEYDEYIASCNTGQTIEMGCNVDPDPGTGNFTGADMEGEDLQNAPEWNATLGLDYFVALNSNWNLAFNVTTSYKDDYNPTASLLSEDRWQDSFWLTNASASLSSSDNKWEFFVRGINLGDEYYSGAGFSTPFSGNSALTGTSDPSGVSDFTQAVEGGTRVTVGLTYRM